MWWHAVVGNDSVTAPVVDEPLAQYSACVVMQDIRPADADAVCDAHLATGYQQMRMMGLPDAAADQPTTAFESSLQYGGVVYGKAPGLFRALEDQIGSEATRSALGRIVDRHAFEQLDGDDLRKALGDAVRDEDLVDRLWQRWVAEPNGDQDLVAGENATGLGGFGGMGGLAGDDELQRLLDLLLAQLEGTG